VSSILCMSQSNGPYPQWCHKIKMAAIIGGLCTGWYWERWRLATITFIYCSKGKVRYTYLLTRQMHAVLHPYQNLGLVLPGWIISHHITLTSLLYFHGSILWKPQKVLRSSFWLLWIDTWWSPPTNTAILSIMMSLQIRSICLTSYACNSRILPPH